MTRSAVLDLYVGLTRSSFLSAYASTNPWDDFADSLAYYLMNHNLGTSYRIHTQQGLIFDIMWKLNSPLFTPKLQYIENFLNRKDIRYP